MHPNDDMSRVVSGKRYTVKTAILLASDEYWDGNNFEHGGRNIFLYKTRGGAFFQVTLTQWQGEKDTITPLSREEAMELYESLREHDVDYEKAFDAVVEEANSGRPTYFDQPMRQTAIWLPEDMIAWLKSTGGMGDKVRDLIAEAMKK
jgi:uncharacterized protein (DUF4415 family)